MAGRLGSAVSVTCLHVTRDLFHVMVRIMDFLHSSSGLPKKVFTGTKAEAADFLRLSFRSF